jgi:anti-sigma B factor antagonist
MLFDARVTEHEAWSVVRVIGEVDLASMPTLRQTADRALGVGAIGRIGPVAVDLTDVDLLDPVCVGVLVSARLRAERAGSRFVVVCPPGRVRDLLAESLVDRIMTVVPTVDDLHDAVPDA